MIHIEGSSKYFGELKFNFQKYSNPTFFLQKSFAQRWWFGGNPRLGSILGPIGNQNRRLQSILGDTKKTKQSPPEYFG